MLEVLHDRERERERSRVHPSTHRTNNTINIKYYTVDIPSTGFFGPQLFEGVSFGALQECFLEKNDCIIPPAPAL